MSDKIQSRFRRHEKKYFLSPKQQELFLAGARDYMKDDVHKSYTICNIYYDTDDWSLIRKSLEKPDYKEKLRVRSYGVPEAQDNVFVEIKKKYDGIVYKRRVVMEAGKVKDYLSGSGHASPEGQISHEIDWFQKFHHAKPKVFIGYERLALAGIQDQDLRVTFDTDIRWRDTDLDLMCGDHGMLILPEDTIVMELKIQDAVPLWLSHLLNDVGAFPTSFSKYGTCYKDFILGGKSAARKAV